MLIVETIGRIRREYLVKGRSIKEIARDLRISRNTVGKILRSEGTAFSYEREVQPRPRLGRWKADLDRMLTENVGTAARERLTLIRLFEELRAPGYAGVTMLSAVTRGAGVGSMRARRRRSSCRCRSRRVKPTSSTGAMRLF
jgi:hypothetical protein